MNGFNYFALYSGVKQQKNGLDIKKIIRSFFVLLSICAIVYGLFCYKLTRYQSQLEYTNSIKMDTGFNAQYSIAAQVASKIKSAEAEYRFAEALDNCVILLNTGNQTLISLINNCINGRGYLTRISVDGRVVKLDGYVTDINTLTAIERSFRASGAFTFVLVETVEENGMDVSTKTFTCQLTLEGGAILYENHE